MNSTGTKLNRQELRNAGWFGEFKMSVYESALKYFEEWRKWKVFTDDNISRMDEVELSTEFYSLMLRGITGKSQNSLDNLYNDYDNEGTFKERNVIEKRFEVIMDTIDEHLGDYVPKSPFRKKTLFYILFTVVYDICYGLNSDLNNKANNKITNNQVNILRHIGSDLEKGAVDEGILEAATRRTTNPLERKTLLKYFKKRMDG